MKEWGLIESALVLVLVAVVMIVLISLFTSWNEPNPCQYTNTQECKNHLIEQCIQEEKWTRQECIDMWSGVQE